MKGLLEICWDKLTKFLTKRNGTKNLITAMDNRHLNDSVIIGETVRKTSHF